MAKPTIKSLQLEMAELTTRLEQRSKALGEANTAKRQYEELSIETHKQFDDLKRRLHDAEVEVARLNGYLARVREDDSVREELVTVGEPGGEQRMVPKRKHEFLGNREPSSTYDMMATDDYGRRQKPKHWITY